MTSPPTNLLCQYRYDPLDRLVHLTQPDTPAHQRFYCKSRLATEIHGATTHSIIQHDDLLMAEQQREDDVLDTTLLVTDLQRSVLHTLKKDNQQQRIVYAAYGHRPTFNGLLSLLGFTGERQDSVTGHYLLGNGYRRFNPVLMRFNSPDSFSPFGSGGLNSYSYCLGDPINLSDTTGHTPQPSTIYTVSLLAKKWLNKTRSNSFKPPRPVQGPKGNMENVSLHGPGAVTFTDKNNTRLNIFAHGGVESTDTQDASVLMFTHEQGMWETKDVISLIHQKSKNQNFDSVRLLSCYSARGGNNSLAAQISEKINIPVKGYEQVLSVSNTLSPNFYGNLYRHYEATNMPPHYFQNIEKNHALIFKIRKDIESHKPVRFSRGKRFP